MKTLNEYLNESIKINESDFVDSVPDYYKNSELVNHILETLKKYGIPAKLNLSTYSINIWNPRQNFSGFSSSFSIHIGRKEHSNTSGLFYTSSNFDDEITYLSITASFKGENDEKIFKKLLDSNLKEATDGKNPQWGSYKFAIRSEEDLIFICKLLKANIKKI